MSKLRSLRQAASILASLALLTACNGKTGIQNGDGGPNNGANNENNANNDNNGPNNGTVNNTIGDNNVIVDPDPPHSGGDPYADPHPNLQSQAELFMCNDELQSSPVRVRRIDPKEWARAVYQDDYATRIPFLADAHHWYRTYAADETLDGPTLQEVMRVYQNVGNSWRASTGNEYPRIAIMRQDSAAKDKTYCFQNRSGGPQTDDPDEACIRSFIEGLLEYGVLFRPPTTEQVDALVPFAQERLAEEERVAGSVTSEARAKTIQMIARAAWLTHGALFRPEVGGEPDADGRRRLSDWEFGLALSYAIGHTAPGQSKQGYQTGATHITLLPEVRQAMEDGTITEPDKIAEIVRYHLAGAGTPTGTIDVDGTQQPLDPPVGPEKEYQEGSSASTIEPFYEDQYWMSRKLEAFFHEWLGHASSYDVFKDTPEATSAYTSPPPRTPSYRHRRYADQAYTYGQHPRLLDNMIARIVAEDQNVLENLLTSRRFLLPEGGNPGDEDAPYQGYIYDIDIDSGGVIPSALPQRWVDMPADQRAGVLTHPAWLAAHGGNFENDPNPIYRGKWIWENLLCGWVDELPVGVNAMLPVETANSSTRERFESAGIDAGYCAACHGSMNPFGYAFEIYNHAGYMRADDHGSPPDGSSTLNFTPVPYGDSSLAHLTVTPGDTVLQDGLQVDSAVEMMEVFAQSRHVKQCFVRQTFRYFMGRDETTADACTLVEMEQAYDDSDGSMIEMLIALFGSDAFLYRHVPVEEEEEDSP